jgi:hypothetical protein
MTRILLLVLFQLDQRSPDFILSVHAKVMSTPTNAKTDRFHLRAPWSAADSVLLLALMMRRSFSQVLI